MVIKVKNNFGHNQINKVNKNKKKDWQNQKDLENKIGNKKNEKNQHLFNKKKSLIVNRDDETDDDDMETGKKVKKEELSENDSENEISTEDDRSEDDVSEDDESDVENLLKNISKEIKNGDINSSDQEEDESSDEENEKELKDELKIKEDPKSSKKEHSNEFKERTVRIENLKGIVTSLHVRKFFGDAKTGKIETIHFKTTELKPLKINDKSIKAHVKKFGSIAFVRFINKEGAEKALTLNGELLRGRHIRIASCKQQTLSQKEELAKSTIMVGNLKYGADEEKLHQLFSTCGEINYIKLVKNIKGCTGYGFINFKKPESVTIALSIQNTEFDGNKLRISRAISNTKQKKKPQKKAPRMKHAKLNKKGHVKIDINKKYGDKKSDNTPEFEGKKIKTIKKEKKFGGKGLKEKMILAKKLTMEKKV